MISGNNQDGIQLINGTTFNNVFGNLIGTDPFGMVDPDAPFDLGNLHDGIRISDATNNEIGGDTAAKRNVIAANQANRPISERS